MNEQLRSQYSSDPSRAIIALNNIGVHLLERHYYVEAVDVCERASKRAGGILHEHSDYGGSTAQQDMAMAIHYMSQMRPSAIQESPYPAVITLTSVGSLEINFHNSSPCSTIGLIVSDPPTGVVSHAIRIEDINEDNVFLDSFRAQLATIVSHNFALACTILIRSTRRRNPVIEQQICQVAMYHALRSTCTWIQQLAKHSTTTQPRPQVDQVLLLHCLAMASVRTLINLYEMSEQTREADQWDHRLVHLRRAAIRLRGIMSSIDGSGGQERLAIAAGAA